MRVTFLKSRRGWLVGALIIGIIALLIWRRPHSVDSELSIALPSPNGYDDFVAAEKELKGGLPDMGKQPAKELSRIVTEHASSLKRAREGLTRNCRVPLDYSHGFTNMMDHLALAKALGLLLREEGHLAEMNSDYSKALQCYLETIQFSSKRFQGGLLIHQLVRIAVAKSAETRLEQMISNLNTQDCRKAITSLLEVEQAEEPPPEVLRRDAEWVRRVSGGSHLEAMVVKLSPQFKKNQTAAAAKLHEQTRFRRNLCILLAARAFELEIGKAPNNVSDLVPKYLPNVPKDPITAADLTLQH